MLIADFMTHTYAKLEIPRDFYELVRSILLKHGYEHAFDDLRDPDTPIDMTGIALVPPEKLKPAQWCKSRS